MSTLDLIAALADALKRHDLAAVQRLLFALDRRLPPEEVGAWLETLTHVQPSGPNAPASPATAA